MAVVKIGQGIVGYQSEYIDGRDRKYTITRIAAKHEKEATKMIKKTKKITFFYNEHLLDIELTFNFKYISSIELTTSFGRVFTIGFQDEYTSISRADTSQKAVLAIVAFETCFSDECLKEMTIYRSPIRYKKKNKVKVMSVDEINEYRNSLLSHQPKKNPRALFQELTKKNILRMRAIKNFGMFMGIKKNEDSSESGGMDQNKPGSRNDAAEVSHAREGESISKKIEEMEFGEHEESGGKDSPRSKRRGSENKRSGGASGLFDLLRGLGGRKSNKVHTEGQAKKSSSPDDSSSEPGSAGSGSSKKASNLDAEETSKSEAISGSGSESPEKESPTDPKLKNNISKSRFYHEKKESQGVEKFKSNHQPIYQEDDAEETKDKNYEIRQQTPKLHENTGSNRIFKKTNFQEDAEEEKEPISENKFRREKLTPLPLKMLDGVPALNLRKNPSTEQVPRISLKGITQG